MSQKFVPALRGVELAILRHLADGALIGELPNRLGVSQTRVTSTYAGMCERLGAPRDPAALLAICYATETVQPPDLLDPSDVVMPAEERDVLALFARGLTLSGMARHLGRERWKVAEQVKAITADLQAKTWAQAVHIGWQYQIVTGPAIRSWLENPESESAATSEVQSPVRRTLGPALYIQAREGEAVETPRALCAARDTTSGLPGLSYWDQAADDRDERGALWARSSEILSRSGRPVGPPLQVTHPARQPLTMKRQRCRLGDCPARLQVTTGHAYLYLVTDNERRPGGSYRTAEPPACVEHALLCAESEPRLQGEYTALLVTSSTVSGVLGTRYGPLGDDVNVAAVGEDLEFHPYADTERLRWVLAHQLVRDLWSYKVIDLRRLIRKAFRTPPGRTAASSSPHPPSTTPSRAVQPG
ncbi:hypothetical protein [Streptomyces sp. NPDC092903]|uniref:hypothetical protein n=1 Tax=Streptomyces sp. NPDC092903 TaxID=3366017 RepID=UPI0037FC2208